MHKIAVIPGDGIGPEVILPSIELINQFVEFERVDLEVGYKNYKRNGTPISDDTLDQIASVDAIFFGAVTTPPNIEGYQSPILQIRKEFDLYANIRSTKSIPNLSINPNVDFIIIRENTEGLYTGIEHSNSNTAVTERVISRNAVTRIVNFTINYMRKHSRAKLTLVHKANVLRQSDGLFLSIFNEICENENSNNFSYNDRLVDSTALQLISKPEQFDTVVTSNMFGDILSDLATFHISGLGMASSSNIGENLGLFEPVHGSAPDIAGKGIANPYGSLFSLVSLLRYLKENHTANILETVILQCIEDQIFTIDIGGTYNTSHVINRIMLGLEDIKI